MEKMAHVVLHKNFGNTTIELSKNATIRAF